MTGRRLVVCFDGTWNDPDKGAKPTNVVKMVRAVRAITQDGVSQVVFYDKGVGTAGGTDALFGGAFGAGLLTNVIDGYRFLANNYEDGDEIYVFGFSRGAFTARSLAGLIGLGGLLHPAKLGGGLRELVDVYKDETLDATGKRVKADGLKIGPRHRVRIACVGVWDTVGSLGVPGDIGNTFKKKKYYFHDVQLGADVDVALHAAAIDEKRGPFAPTLWVSKDGRPTRDDQTVEQVWFSGVHSNVGGSYADATLSDIAFDWMVQRVTAHTKLDLDWQPSDATASRNAGGIGIDSRTWMYTVSRGFPYQRVINGHIPPGQGFGGWFRKTFPKFDRRNIPPNGLKTINEALHVSAIDRWKLDSVPHDCRDPNASTVVPYRPVNLAAALAQSRDAGRIPVIGWDGRRLSEGEAVAIWPAGPYA